MSKREDDTPDVHKVPINTIANSIKNGCSALIGPEAFINIKTNKSLREEFILAAKSFLKKSGSDHLKLDADKDSVISATIKMHEEAADEAEEWIKQFWEGVEVCDYPNISNHARIKYNAYYYFGYDTLLASQINNAVGLGCYPSGEEIVVRELDDTSSRGISVDKIESFCESFGKQHQVPVINLFGDTSSTIQDVDGLVRHVYGLLVQLKGEDDNAALKSIVNSVGGQFLSIIGVDMSFWNNKMVALSLKSIKERNFKAKLLHDRKSFDDQLDSSHFMSAMGFGDKAASVPVSESSRIHEKFILLNEQFLRPYKGNVFISYAYDDIETARLVATRFEQFGWKAHVLHDDRNNPSKTWKDRATETMDVCKIFVLIGTETSEAKWGADSDRDDPINVECRSADSREVNENSDSKFRIVCLNFSSKKYLTRPFVFTKDVTWYPVKNTKEDLRKMIGNIVNETDIDINIEKEGALAINPL